MAIQSFSHQNITVGAAFMLDVTITGAPSRVWVEGDLEGFHYRWTGKRVEIRGTATRLRTNAKFTIHAGTEQRSGTYSVVPAAPVITTPGKQTLYKGATAKIEVTITNAVDKLSAAGEWIGLKLKRGGKGAIIEGTIPNQNFAISKGTMQLIATNGGGTDRVNIPWEFGTPAAPTWQNIPDPYTYEIGNNFALDLDSYVTGKPSPDIARQSGSIPGGLTFDVGTHQLSGKFTHVGVYAPVFRATNVGGTADSEQINFVVVQKLTAPSYLSGLASTWYVRSTSATLDMSSYFSVGAPAGTYSVVVTSYPGEGEFDVHINATTGILSVSNISDGERMSARVAVQNSQGTAHSRYFDISIDL